MNIEISPTGISVDGAMTSDVDGIQFTNGLYLLTEAVTVTASGKVTVIAAAPGSTVVQGDAEAIVAATKGTVRAFGADRGKEGCDSKAAFLSR